MEEERNQMEQDIDELLDIHEEKKEEKDILQPVNLDMIIKENTSRFSSAEWFDTTKQQKIIVGGCGGIGSNAIFQLARTNIDYIIVYDDDKVDMTNLAGQMFDKKDVGQSKSYAIYRKCIEFSDSYINYFQKKIDSTINLYKYFNIFIGCFDNMKARKQMFELFCKQREYFDDKSKMLFIDGRLSAEYMQVISFTGDDEYSMRKYENNYLFDSSEAEETVCSYKQTSFCANIIGSLITNVVVNFCANLVGDIRPLPFLIEYDATIMKFTLNDD